MEIDVKEKFLCEARADLLPDPRFKTIDGTDYFAEPYKQTLIADMEKRGLYDCYRDLEFEDYGGGRTKICKLTSSSRLCYLYFSRAYEFASDPENWVLEDTSFTFRGDNGKSTRAHFDCRLDTYFFETKCEEFFNKHEDYLPAHFYKKLLKDSFEIEGEIPQENDQLFPTLQQFGITDYDGTIYDMHFDVKQLLTHLLALAARKTYEYDFVTLRYIWFVPSTSRQRDAELEEFEQNLFHEFNVLREALPIKKFCFKHGIILKFECQPMPENPKDLL